MRPILPYLWKLPLVGLSYALGAFLGGALAPLLGLPMPAMPEGGDALGIGQHLLASGLLVALALALLGRGLAGLCWRRWLVLALFCAVSYPLNAALVASTGAAAFTIVSCLPACLFAGLVTAFLFPGPEPRLRCLPGGKADFPFPSTEHIVDRLAFWRRGDFKGDEEQQAASEPDGPAQSPAPTLGKAGLHLLSPWESACTERSEVVGVRVPHANPRPVMGGPASVPAPTLRIVGGKLGARPGLKPRGEETKPPEGGWERAQPASASLVDSGRPFTAGRPVAGDKPPRYRGSAEETDSFWTSSGLDSLPCRLTLAVLALPVIYLIFAWLAAPVGQHYQHAVAPELVAPDLEQILAPQLLRGALFVAALLPLVAVWRRSRWELALSLGFAFWVLTGHSAAAAHGLPWQMPIGSGPELLAGSFLYAAAISVLLLRPGTWPLGGARNRPSAQM